MNWFSRKRNIVVAAVAALLAVVATVLVIYGVTTHEEAGLLRVCWLTDGTAVYLDPDSTEAQNPENSPCVMASKLTWPREQIPLKVGLYSYREGDLRPLRAALADINQQLGFRLFQEVPLDQDYSVNIGFEPVDPSIAIGWAEHAKSSGDHVLFCNISIQTSAVTDRMVYLVAHHELLHCAGLAHDPDNPASAIYPFTNDDSMEDTMVAARITDFDRALLRRLYHD